MLNTHQYQANIGVEIKRLDNGHIIYQNNAHQFYTPASLVKLFTATAALQFLGPDFTFDTRLFSNSVPSPTGVLTGDVLLRFSADPTLTTDDLTALITHLKALNFNTIKGNFYIDDTAFNSETYGPGWMWDELNLCYAAPVTSIIVDKNCLHATIKPSDNIGLPASLTLDQPAKGLVSLFNNTLTEKAGRSDCALHLKSSTLNSYSLSGCLPQKTAPKVLNIAIKNPRAYTKLLIKQLLKAQHIDLQGPIKFQKLAPGYQQLAVHHSQPLKQLLTEMLKHSDNLIAGALHKTLGAKYFHKPGGWENGTQAIEKILAPKTQIAFQKTRLKDGAGLSRYNLITPHKIDQLLDYLYHTPALNSVLLPALPIAGVDGTLEHRMQHKKAFGRVRAKTGTMTGVSTLAGYTHSQNHIPLSFVIMANGFIVPEHKVQALEDKLCEWLVKLQL